MKCWDHLQHFPGVQVDEVRESYSCHLKFMCIISFFPQPWEWGGCLSERWEHLLCLFYKQKSKVQKSCWLERDVKFKLKFSDSGSCVAHCHRIPHLHCDELCPFEFCKNFSDIEFVGEWVKSLDQRICCPLPSKRPQRDTDGLAVVPGQGGCFCHCHFFLGMSCYVPASEKINERKWHSS